CQLAAGRELVVHLAVEGLVAGARVRPVAFDEEVSEVHVVSERSDGVAGVDAGTELPEAAVADIRPHGTGRGAVRGEDLDDTARGVAIERGEGSTEHLDPLRGVQVELRD